MCYEDAVRGDTLVEKCHIVQLSGQHSAWHVDADDELNKGANGGDKERFQITGMPVDLSPPPLYTPLWEHTLAETLLPCCPQKDIANV